MNHIKNLFGICISVCFILLILESWTTVTNANSRFDGTSEYYNVMGQNSNIQFKAEKVYFMANTAVFRSVNNINIEKWDEECISKNSSPAIQINYKDDVYSILSYVDADIRFKNSSIIWSNSNQIQIEGYINENWPYELKSNCQVMVTDQVADSVFIGSEEFTDFKSISFEMDNSSHFSLFSELIKLDCYGVSNSKINGQFSQLINVGEGDLRLNANHYHLKNTDSMLVKVNPNSSSSIDVNDAEIKFNALSINSANVNGQNLMKGQISYWFNYKIEIINALATSVLVLATILYVFLTAETLGHQEKISTVVFAERRLEKLYYPLQTLLHSPVILFHDGVMISQNFDLELLDKIIPFEYLASKELSDKLRKFMKNKIAIKNELGYVPFEIEDDDISKIVEHDIDIFKNQITELVKES